MELLERLYEDVEMLLSPGHDGHKKRTLASSNTDSQ